MRVAVKEMKGDRHVGHSDSRHEWPRLHAASACDTCSDVIDDFEHADVVHRRCCVPSTQFRVRKGDV